MKRILFSTKSLLLSLLLVSAVAEGQNFRKSYDFGGNEIGQTVISLQDGGFLMVGSRLVRTDAQGNMVWSSPLPFIASFYWTHKMAVIKPNGNFVIANFSGNTFLNQDLHLCEFDSNGNLLWWKHEETPGRSESVKSLAMTPDGGYIINMDVYFETCACYKLYLVKTDENGEKLWENDLEIVDFVGSNDITTTSDGGYAIAATKINIDNNDPLLIKTDTNGDVLWEKTWPLENSQTGVSVLEHNNGKLLMSFYTGNGVWANFSKVHMVSIGLDGNDDQQNIVSGDHWICTDMVMTPDGDLAISGYGRMGFDQDSVYGGILLLANQAGQPIWQRIFENGTDLLENITLRGMALTQDGGFVLCGDAYLTGNNGQNMLLIKTSDDGYVFPNRISGKVYKDLNENCAFDQEDAPVVNNIVKAVGTSVYYASVRQNGTYSLEVPDGTYEVESEVPSPIWENCGIEHAVVVPGQNSYVDFAFQAIYDCVLMEVDLVASNLRPCFPGYYVVRYCNHGNITADNATVQVTLPDELSYTDATLPLIAQDGQILTFQIGNLGVEECGDFIIHFNVECDPELIGQSLCAEAIISPPSDCFGSQWAGPNISTFSNCETDSVAFTLTNEGEDMPDPFEFIVIEDNVILLTDEFQLEKNQQISVKLPAQNGATYHLVAAQAANFPYYLGNPIATTSIEACEGEVNEGALLQLPADDGETWRAIHCQTVVNSYDPNDKQALPTGWQEEHFIENRTELDYIIRFQNTGTAPAVDVKLVDLLSPFLDPATVRPGASSHPYTFSLSGQGILEFKFTGINLPDSTSNEPASHGFVKFHIAQQPGNPVGTVIENTASIFFDYNPPIITNTTFHTIGEPWVSVLEVEPSNLQVLVFPNPVTNIALFRLPEIGSEGNRSFCLYDVAGRQVCQREFKGGWYQFEREDLATGLYFFRIESGGKKIGAGKLLVK